ncbi:MAG: hypothetical protein ACLFUY_03000 [Desulfobacterales bacterium]
MDFHGKALTGEDDLLICVPEGALLSQKGQFHVLALPLAVLERAADF